MSKVTDSINVSDKEIMKKVDELEGSDRSLTGWMALLVLVFAVGMSLFHLYTAGIGMFPRMQQNAIHLGFGLTLAFLIFPYRKG